jgi:hypothetical protein
MANHCFNTLKVKGNLTQLNHFISKVKDEDGNFILDKLFPVKIDDDLLNFDLDDEEFEQEYMDVEEKWMNEYWGTTYIYTSSFSQLSKCEVHIIFTSRFSPPVNWTLCAARLYGRLKFKLEYDEPGIGFYGKLDAKGQLVREYRNVRFSHPLDFYKRIFKETDNNPLDNLGDRILGK